MEKGKSIFIRHTDARSIIQSYSRIAWIYDIWARLTESKAAREVIELAEIHDGQRILEVAVGTGFVFAEILRQNKNGETFGVDIAPDMLTRADRRVRYTQNGHFHLQIASSYRLPFDSNSFDLLINNFMFKLLPEEDFPVALREFHRVLKPGGILVLSTMTFGERWYNDI